MHSIATVIMAAGKGTRMKSNLPKVLHPLNGRAMVHYVIDVADAIGSKKTILIVGHKKELVEAECTNRRVSFAVQSPQLGTGHAVQQAGPQLNNFKGDILVLSGDVPLLTAATIEKLIHTHQNSKATATLLTARLDNPAGYGRVIRNATGMVDCIVEHKDANAEQLKIDEINVGIYIFKADDLFAALKQVKNNNAQGEYYLPDVIPLFLSEGKMVNAVVAESFDETRGINTIDQLKEAEDILLKRDK